MKKATIILSTICMIGILFGCSSSKANKKLSVYCYTGNSNLEAVYSNCVREFTVKYPDLDFSIYDPTGGDSSVSCETSMVKMNADIMSGNGPDLVISFPENMYKKMKSGAFIDLNEFILSDEEASKWKINPCIQKSGQYKENQLTLPLFYSVPTITSTEDMLKKYQIEKKILRHLMDILKKYRSFSLLINRYECTMILELLMIHSNKTSGISVQTL